MLTTFMVHHPHDAIKERKDEPRLLEYITGWDILSYAVHKSAHYPSPFYNLITRANSNCHFPFYLKHR